MNKKSKTIISISIIMLMATISLPGVTAYNMLKIGFYIPDDVSPYWNCYSSDPSQKDIATFKYQLNKLTRMCKIFENKFLNRLPNNILFEAQNKSENFSKLTWKIIDYADFEDDKDAVEWFFSIMFVILFAICSILTGANNFTALYVWVIMLILACTIFYPIFYALACSYISWSSVPPDIPSPYEVFCNLGLIGLILYLPLIGIIAFCCGIGMLLFAIPISFSLLLDVMSCIWI